MKNCWRQTKFWLLLIVLLAGVLRFWQLGTNPPALTWDEASWGYNAYSLGLTAKDEFGRLLPWNYLESFGDFKPPVYAYLTVLPVKIFGLNQFAVRFASAFLGTLTVVLVYWLVRQIFDRTKQSRLIGLLTGLLLAISPWHIMLSRAAFEANVASFFLIAGVTFFLLGIKKKGWFFLISALSLALAFQTFNTARIVGPLLLVGLVLGFKKEVWQRRTWLIAGGVLGAVLLLPTASFFFSPQSRLRYQEVNIFSDAAVITQANQQMANDDWVWWSSIIHNRRWGHTRAFLSHYFDHFKPSFLFIRGDGNPKFSTQDVGELYLVELPFLLLGVLMMIRRKPKNWWLIFYWLMIGILPAATARETPHALRIETTLPTWQILIALGLVSSWQWLKGKDISGRLKAVVVGSVALVFVFNLAYFQHGYWRHYPVEYSGEWQYGYSQAIDYVKLVGGQYDQVWFTAGLGRPYIYFLYHLGYQPDRFWQEAKIQRDPHGFVFVNGFGKYHFFRDGESLKPQGEALIIDLPDRIPEDEVIIQDFNLLNQELILSAYTNLPDTAELSEKDEEN